MSCLLLNCLDLFMQREQDAATNTRQRGVFDNVTKLVDRMSAQLVQSIAAQLQASVIPSLGNRTGQVLNLSNGVAQGSAAAQSHSDNSQRQGTAVCAAASPELSSLCRRRQYTQELWPYLNMFLAGPKASSDPLACDALPEPPAGIRQHTHCYDHQKRIPHRTGCDIA